MTRLHAAIRENNLDDVEWWLREGSNESKTKKVDGVTAIELAYQLNNPEIIELFQQYGYGINLSNCDEIFVWFLF